MQTTRFTRASRRSMDAVKVTQHRRPPAQPIALRFLLHYLKYFLLRACTSACTRGSHKEIHAANFLTQSREHNIVVVCFYRIFLSLRLPIVMSFHIYLGRLHLFSSLRVRVIKKDVPSPPPSFYKKKASNEFCRTATVIIGTMKDYVCLNYIYFLKSVCFTGGISRNPFFKRGI